ncbi:hypothetical protein LQT98_12610, partial [Chromobacterium aquaticum]|nr:hypothetical protein [Chromobacterium aquaticum]
QFKQAVRRQTGLGRNDEKRALATLEQLLPTDQQRRFALELAILLLQAAGPISQEKQQRLGRLALAMGVAQRNGGVAAETVKPATKRAPRQRKPKPAA